MSKKIERLFKLKLVLAFMQVLSIIGFIFCIIMIRSNLSFIKDAKFYIAEMMVVDSLHCTGGKRPENCSRFAEGIIKNEKKIVLLSLNSSYRKEVSKKDTLPVWNKKGKRQVIIRNEKDKFFPTKKYKKSNFKIISMGIFPIILLWIFKYKISKKIKQLKNETK